jgi:hypothetical protein
MRILCTTKHVIILEQNDSFGSLLLETYLLFGLQFVSSKKFKFLQKTHLLPPQRL